MLNSILDKYFKRPVFWDYFLVTILEIVLITLYAKGSLFLPTNELVYSMVSDFSNISLTSAGFILTLFTVLITFKSGSKITKANYTEDNTVFELFFASDLYHETIRHLKNCVKSLIVVSIVGYTLKLSIYISYVKYIHFFNVGSVVIIALSLWRCLLILTKIVKIQKY